MVSHPFSPSCVPLSQHAQALGRRENPTDCYVTPCFSVLQRGMAESRCRVSQIPGHKTRCLEKEEMIRIVLARQSNYYLLSHRTVKVGAGIPRVRVSISRPLVTTQDSRLTTRTSFHVRVWPMHVISPIDAHRRPRYLACPQ